MKMFQKILVAVVLIAMTACEYGVTKTVIAPEPGLIGPQEKPVGKTEETAPRRLEHSGNWEGLPNTPGQDTTPFSAETDLEPMSSEVSKTEVSEAPAAGTEGNTIAGSPVPSPEAPPPKSLDAPGSWSPPDDEKSYVIVDKADEYAAPLPPEPLEAMPAPFIREDFKESEASGPTYEATPVTEYAYSLESKK